MDVTLALTEARNGPLTVGEIASVVRKSEGSKGDANGAEGHALQHVQETARHRMERPFGETALG